jgi:hypothetical protein
MFAAYFLSGNFCFGPLILVTYFVNLIILLKLSFLNWVQRTVNSKFIIHVSTALTCGIYPSAHGIVKCSHASGYIYIWSFVPACSSAMVPFERLNDFFVILSSKCSVVKLCKRIITFSISPVHLCFFFQYLHRFDAFEFTEYS